MLGLPQVGHDLLVSLSPKSLKQVAGCTMDQILGFPGLALGRGSAGAGEERLAGQGAAPL
jgi:hypothetical protein